MFIKSVSYLKCDNTVKIVIQTKRPCYNALLCVDKLLFLDFCNICEPYDRKTQVFYVPENKLKKGCELVLNVRRFKKLTARTLYKLTYDPVFANSSELKKEYNNGITVKKAKTEAVAQGVEYTHYICENKKGAPVNSFTFTVDTSLASLYVGTTDDGYDSVNVKAKIPDMIDSAVKNGVPVVGAVNADFFDIFGDCHPSGLCVKNSRVISNVNKELPFIGIKKDGTPVITDIAENPDIISSLSQAVSGSHIIVKEGKLFDWAELEPFSYVRHPRTVAGVKKDGTVILLVVDGRIPEYSNGASLVDLAEFMIGLGADRAINLDGGGSSVVYTKDKNGFELRNVPADLFRPRAKLIRKEFNALLIVTK